MLFISNTKLDISNISYKVFLQNLKNRKTINENNEELLMLCIKQLLIYT